MAFYPRGSLTELPTFIPMEIFRGQRAAVGSGVYTPLFLKLYRLYVLKFNFPVLWACDPQKVLVPHFNDGFTTRHLDCGVADGYFPGVALQQLEKGDYHLTLVDLNTNSLEAARSNILSLAPNVHIQCVSTDIRKPLPSELKESSFTSISMFNLFHCVPGGADKWRAISTYKNVLSEDGVLTGCTILGKDYVVGRLAWLTLQFFNFAGSFSNLCDTREDVERALKEDFLEVETRLVGMVLLFTARRPRKAVRS